MLYSFYAIVTNTLTVDVKCLQNGYTLEFPQPIKVHKESSPLQFKNLTVQSSEVTADDSVRTLRPAGHTGHVNAGHYLSAYTWEVWMVVIAFGASSPNL